MLFLSSPATRVRWWSGLEILPRFLIPSECWIRVQHIVESSFVFVSWLYTRYRWARRTCPAELNLVFLNRPSWAISWSRCSSGQPTLLHCRKLSKLLDWLEPLLLLLTSGIGAGNKELESESVHELEPVLALLFEGIEVGTGREAVYSTSQ